MDNADCDFPEPRARLCICRHPVHFASPSTKTSPCPKGQSAPSIETIQSLRDHAQIQTEHIDGNESITGIKPQNPPPFKFSKKLINF